MDKKPFPSETQERFIVRLPDGMRDRIADEAKANGRSMNAEIVARLQASFEGGDIAELAPLLARLESTLSNSEMAYEAMRKLGSIVAMFAQAANMDLPETSEYKLKDGDPMSDIVAVVAEKDIRKTAWKTEPFSASAQAATELQALLRQAKLIK